jgi:hypothetical protein
LRGHENLSGVYADGELGGVTNLAPYFVASFVVNRRQVVLLAAMLFRLTKHVIRT